MGKSSLRRELGLFRATMLGIGGSLSAGNFIILGYAAGLAGSAIVIVVLICGIISLLTMLSYCELGTSIPQAGGEYTFAKATFGGLTAFITGWFEWLSNMFYAAFSALGFAYMISYFIPLNIPLTAILTLIFFTAINIRGVKETGTTESILAMVVLAALAIFIGNGWAATLGMGEFKPAAPRGFQGMLEATAYLFELYLGAEAVAVAQAEIKNPKKTIPRAMLISSGVLIFVYTVTVYITVRMVPTEILLVQESPVAFAAEQIMGRLGALLVTIAITMAGLAAINGAIMAQSRVLYALSRDGYFPKALAKIHKRFGTPHGAIIISSMFTIALAATGIVNFVVYAVNLGFIIGFSLVNLSLMKLRKEKPYLERPFKVPLYPLTPIVGIITSLVLLLFMEAGVLILGVQLSIFALLAYYIRMIGSQRIRVAVGGISLGIGSLTALLTILIKAGAIPFDMHSPLAAIIFYSLIFISAVFILAGILNITFKD